jgi:autoinducer 2-degrading protein
MDGEIMHIVLVHIQVKPEFIDAFKEASLENARNSVKEPGIARFDLIQQTDDPTRFVLVEVYRSLEDAGEHKKTAHYNKWRQLAEPMMAEPRTRKVYANIFPAESGW